MLRFDSDTPSHPEDVSTPARSGRRRGAAAKSINAPKPIEPLAFPRWARLQEVNGRGAEAGFHAGAGLALLDRILRSGHGGHEPNFVGALRQRLALKAAASCAQLARLRPDEAALRDAEHLAPPGAAAAPAGRPHRLFRLFSTRPLRLDAATLGVATELLGLQTAAATLEGLAAALREIQAHAKSPLTAAAGASRAAMVILSEAAPVEAEIISLWLSDLTLAQMLGWERPVPLVATTIAQPALRHDGRRPRPAAADWAEALAGAYALAASEAYGLAGDLSRRAERLLAVEPKLRAKGADRVVALLLADDCIAPARAAKVARLSDRASRRLFDRLIAQGAVRELSGRPNFRLYGL